MTRILITGMSGTGKTTLLNELASRGCQTVDTDYDGWTTPDGTWDEPRIEDLLKAEPNIVVSGTVKNQARFYPKFAEIILLSVPIDVLLDRIAKRTNNPYGKIPEQLAEIRSYVITVEPLLRLGATQELDGRLPSNVLADTVQCLAKDLAPT
ncbi:AAA family ATPase [Arthrobacter flavus]|uniref:AAA family ATPase n=1 Tax=Arthrobacter flavus TaxID=95172 RepID=A0ABW4QA17_9MICC